MIYFSCIKLQREKNLCYGFVYLVIFIVSLVYLFSLTTNFKGVKKIIVVLGILILYVICFILGSFLGYLVGEIYAEENDIFDPGIGNTLTTALEIITFVPGIISIFIYLYEKKKLGKLATIIYMLLAIVIFQIAFFLLLINM